MGWVWSASFAESEPFPAAMGWVWSTWFVECGLCDSRRSAPLRPVARPADPAILRYSLRPALIGRAVGRSAKRSHCGPWAPSVAPLRPPPRTTNPLGRSKPCPPVAAPAACRIRGPGVRCAYVGRRLRPARPQEPPVPYCALFSSPPFLGSVGFFLRAAGPAACDVRPSGVAVLGGGEPPSRWSGGLGLPPFRWSGGFWV